MKKAKTNETKITKRTVDGNLARKLAIVGVPPLYQGNLMNNWECENILRNFIDKKVADNDSFLFVVSEGRLQDSYKVTCSLIEQAYMENKSVSLVGLNSLFTFYKKAFTDRSAEAMLKQKLNHSEIMAFVNLSRELLDLTEPSILKTFRDYLKKRFRRKQKTILSFSKSLPRKRIKSFLGEDLADAYSEGTVARC